MGYTIYFYCFGALVITGGLIGYLAKGSMESLIAGGVTGLVILAANALKTKASLLSFALLLIANGGLLTFFAPSLFSGEIKPQAVIITLGSIVGIILTLAEKLKPVSNKAD